MILFIIWREWWYWIWIIQNSNVNLIKFWVRILKCLLGFFFVGLDPYIGHMNIMDRLVALIRADPNPTRSHLRRQLKNETWLAPSREGLSGPSCVISRLSKSMGPMRLGHLSALMNGPIRTKDHPVFRAKELTHFPWKPHPDHKVWEVGN